MSSVDALNTIIESAILEGFSPNVQSPFRCFGIGKKGISFQGEGARAFAISVTKLYEDNGEVNLTVTKKHFEELLIKTFWESIKQKERVDGRRAAEFYKSILSKPCQTFSVFREIYGIRISDTCPPVSLGPYTIYRFESHKPIIEARAGGCAEDFLTLKIPAYLAEVAVSARHQEKAMELADQRFKQLDSTLRFVVGGMMGRWDGGVSGTPGRRPRETFVFAEDGQVTANYGTEGSPTELDLGDAYFNSQEAWHREIWKYLAIQNLNEMQRRVVLAVNWLGEAYGESSTQMGFLKAAISLEVMFTQNARGIISASVLHNLSESVALIVGKDLDDRIRVEDRMKDLYSQRSSIAHSGSSEIRESDLHDVFYYAQEVLGAFLQRPALLSLEKGKAFSDLLRRAKYSCPEI